MKSWKVWLQLAVAVLLISCETSPPVRWVDGRSIPLNPRWRYKPAPHEIGVKTFAETRVYFHFLEPEAPSAHTFLYYVFFPSGQVAAIIDQSENHLPRKVFDSLKYSTVGYYRIDPTTQRLFVELFTYSAGRWAWIYGRDEWEYSDSFIRHTKDGETRVRLPDAVVTARPDW